MTGKRIAEYHGAGADRFVRGKFIAVVADPTAAGDEEHRSGDKVGKTQGIVSGAAHHAVRLCAEAAGGLFQTLDKHLQELHHIKLVLLADDFDNPYKKTCQDAPDGGGHGGRKHDH